MRWEFRRLGISIKKLGKSLVRVGEDVASALKELFVQVPKDCARFVKNVWDYKELMWNDRDWDHAFILEILQFKIKKTRMYMEKSQRHTCWKKDVADMKRAEALIQAFLDDTVCDELYNAHDEKWGKSKTTFVEQNIESKLRGSIMVSLRPNALTPEKMIEERKEFRQLIKKAHSLEARKWRSLWKNIEKNLRNWWD
jgi:hypothetical protein